VRWTEERIQRAVAKLLRLGVVLSAAVVTLGAVLYLVRHGGEPSEYATFHPDRSGVTTVRAVLAAALRGSARDVIQCGLLILIATPVARVALALAAFSLQRDWTYVVVTAIVLVLLILSLTGSLS
jgi:uncharacterized membrane protein